MTDNPHWYWLKGNKFNSWANDNKVPLSRLAWPEMVWVDMETTGLNEYEDVPLEIGVILTDRVGRVIKNGVASWYIWDDQTDHWISRVTLCSSIVMDMHTKSGLWDKLDAEAGLGTAHFMRPGEVALNVRTWLDLRCEGVVDWNGELRQAPLSGSSPQFDRKFLNAYMPDLNDWFHYRNGADVSATRNLQRLHQSSATLLEPKKRELHRPIPDLLDSLELYRHQLQTFLLLDSKSRDML